jgi:hypothetical protein
MKAPFVKPEENNDKIDPTENRQYANFGAFAAATFVWIVFVLIIADERGDGILRLKPNELGDLLAGMFTPIAAFWFVYAVSLQSEELALQREELKETRAVLEKTMFAQEKMVKEYNKNNAILRDSQNIENIKFLMSMLSITFEKFPNMYVQHEASGAFIEIYNIDKANRIRSDLVMFQLFANQLMNFQSEIEECKYSEIFCKNNTRKNFEISGDYKNMKIRDFKLNMQRQSRILHDCGRMLKLSNVEDRSTGGVMREFSECRKILSLINEKINDAMPVSGGEKYYGDGSDGQE